MRHWDLTLREYDQFPFEGLSSIYSLQQRDLVRKAEGGVMHKYVISIKNHDRAEKCSV